eukprot:s1350_g20.t1
MEAWMSGPMLQERDFYTGREDLYDGLVGFEVAQYSLWDRVDFLEKFLGESVDKYPQGLQSALSKLEDMHCMLKDHMSTRTEKLHGSIQERLEHLEKQFEQEHDRREKETEARLALEQQFGASLETQARELKQVESQVEQAHLLGNLRSSLQQHADNSADKHAMEIGQAHANFGKLSTEREGRGAHHATMEERLQQLEQAIGEHSLPSGAEGSSEAESCEEKEHWSCLGSPRGAAEEENIQFPIEKEFETDWVHAAEKEAFKEGKENTSRANADEETNPKSADELHQGLIEVEKELKEMREAKEMENQRRARLLENFKKACAKADEIRAQGAERLQRAREEREAAQARRKAAANVAAPPQAAVVEDPETAAKKRVQAKLTELQKVEPKEQRAKEFRNLLRDWHPDKNPENKDMATAVFQFLQKGKSLLNLEEGGAVAASKSC